jgi:hypothetical protein
MSWETPEDGQKGQGTRGRLRCQTCMLIKGDLEAADLRGSWAKSNEPEIDVPEPGPYR